MTEQKSEENPRDFIRILPGIGISLAALTLIFFIVDWQDVLAALKQADYIYLILGIPVYLLGYVFRAMAWRTLLQEEVSFKKVFFTMQAGYLLNNVLPFRLGELGRAFLLGRRGLGFWRVFSTILIERAFDMVLAAGFLLGTMSFVIGSPLSNQVAYIVFFFVVLGLGILHLTARYQVWVLSKIEHLSNRWSILSRFGVERFQAFFDGLAALVQLPRFFRVMTWMVTSWGLAIGYHYLVLLAFEPNAKLLWAAFSVGAVSLGVALPSTPSYVGVLEAAWIGALALFSVPFSTALAYALVVHIIHILISCIFGIFALISEGESLGKIYANLRNRRFE
jgi:uncharacterized protein (TIRG00374 family)